MITPYPYQKEAVDKTAALFRDGFRKILFQMPTGGGKTISFSYLIQRYLKARPNKKVLILIHREVLLVQSYKALSKFNISINDVTVAMVESANRRLKKNRYHYGDIGLLIVDECHIGNFRKIYDFFLNSYIIGFTATPISTSKKFPLNMYFQDIVCSTNIKGLIDLKRLSPNITYHIPTIDKKNLKKVRGEYSNASQMQEYSKTYNVENTVKAYEQRGKNTKTLIFNVNREHSKIVNQAFLKHGYNSRHLDATMTLERKETLRWFKNTPNAILNNIGILTTGFDEPSIETIIVNKSTKSIPLWLQMCGRGGRVAPSKTHFTIIDLGGNAIDHGDWNSVRDWQRIFHFPMKSDGGGVAPVKHCDSCQAIIYASARKCNFCGFEFPQKEVGYDVDNLNLVKFTDSINVESIIARNKEYNEYRALHVIKGGLVKKFKKVTGSDKIDSKGIKILEEMFLEKIQEWCKEKDKKFNKFHKTVPLKWLEKEINSSFQILEETA